MNMHSTNHDNNNFTIQKRVEIFQKAMEACPLLVYAGEKSLRQPSTEVGHDEAMQLAEKLKSTLLDYRSVTGLGRGVAAPQIGINKKVFVTYVDDKFEVFINPQILEVSKEKNLLRELCMSSGVFCADIKRSRKVKLSWTNQFGEKCEKEFDGFWARLIQHEYDHLEGILNLDVCEKGSIEFVVNNPKDEKLRDEKVMSKNRKIIFVHGFGVRKDARGIFTDLEKSFQSDVEFKNVEFVLTDLNTIREGDNNIYLNPLEKQKEILEKVFLENSPKQAQTSKEADDLYIVAHSQGCVVTCLANLPIVTKVFFLAPPSNNDLEKSIQKFKEKTGTAINLEGDSILVRRDGSKTIVPKEYWQGRENLDYLKLYKDFSRRQKVVTIMAKADQVVANDCKEEFEKFGKIIWVKGNHNFDGQRDKLAETIKANL
jgi:peptide deformylase